MNLDNKSQYQQDLGQWSPGRRRGSLSMCTISFCLPNWRVRVAKAKPSLLPPNSLPIRGEVGKAQAPRSREAALTLMLLLSMVSKSSGTILGTWLTRLIRKRPTVLSADTFPD